MRKIKRDSIEVAEMYKNKTKLTAVCQVRVIDEKPRYTNVAVQRISFKYKKFEYELDHVWLQQCDYPKEALEVFKKWGWYEVEFTFYQYRDKTVANKHGRYMHGMTVTKVRPISKNK